MGKTFKNSYSLTYERIWESFLFVFIIPSVANKINTHILYYSSKNEILLEKLFMEMLVFYLGRNGFQDKEDLVFIVPDWIFKKFILENYGVKVEEVEKTPACISSIFGIKMEPVDCLKKSILLVKKKVATVKLDYSFSDNNLDMNINPLFETRWLKAVLV